MNRNLNMKMRTYSIAVFLIVVGVSAVLSTSGLPTSGLPRAGKGMGKAAASESSDSLLVVVAQDQSGGERRAARRKARNRNKRPVDAKNIETGNPEPVKDPELASFSRFAATAPMPGPAEPVSTGLPLDLQKGERIAFIGNTLFERAADFGYFESFLQQRFPDHQLVIRNLTWSADEIDLQPRPANFASLDQQLTLEKIDLIFAAFGYNESFAGLDGLPSFRQRLRDFLVRLKSSAFNGKTGPRIVLVSPIANENIKGVSAADRNNSRIKLYVAAMKEIAAKQSVGFADVFSDTLKAMSSTESDLTFNGIHLVDEGYRTFSSILFQKVFHDAAPGINESLRRVVLDKNQQYFRRYRPLNTFYYTGGRNKRYGYLDFLPAMRNFDLMVSNRDQRIWDLAVGKKVEGPVDDSNIPEMPVTAQSRGGNDWMSPDEEYSSFKIDPRFEVNLFASEEDFPEIACPIQMRWDAKGRLWVSCSTTYPHVYPGHEPNDKIVILEDTDWDGKADRITVFADDLQIPLSFELGDGGVYVSEEPFLVFLKDTDGDGKADFRRKILAGFGSEDSHHALHDFVWTPDGDLLFRESIFHHSQIETPYGPIRADNSAWFRFRPDTHRLVTFGNYPNTNPWGVTFDDWGHHVASHPVFASAFHATNPPYPEQHPRATGIPAYSGVCGHEFVDFDFWPEELQDCFIKVRYKPSNRVEIHKWIEKDDHFEESYQGDLLYSSNLSFIPTDLRYGPRGAMYICDWYNPIKGHAQYSLRDERRDRSAGRIWRIVPKGATLQDPPKIAGASISKLLNNLKRREYRYRYWTKRELRGRHAEDVRIELDEWVKSLDATDPRFRHHQIEAVWLYRNISKINPDLLRELLGCEEHHARAAAVRQLRYWYGEFPDSIKLLRTACNDINGIVRMEAAIAASYIGSVEALDAMLDVANHPRDTHLNYAFTCSLGAESLRRHWEGNPEYAAIPLLLKQSRRSGELVERGRSASQAEFDSQKNLKSVRITCLPERMKYDVEQFTVKTGQPVKLVLVNPDATDHNLVIVQPGALEEVGMAANEMAKDPRNANSDFIPSDKKDKILHFTAMIGPTRSSRIQVLRFNAPHEPGIYPYVCTFPGHWVIMTGEMLVVDDLSEIDDLIASRNEQVTFTDWSMNDFKNETFDLERVSALRGEKAFKEARCDQCHVIDGKGTELGPDLTKISEKYEGRALLRQILDPSSEINEHYRTYHVVKRDGEVIIGTILKEDESSIHLVPNLLNPKVVVIVSKKQIKRKTASELSSMPQGMVAALNREQILELLAYLQLAGEN